MNCEELQNYQYLAYEQLCVHNCDRVPVCCWCDEIFSTGYPHSSEKCLKLLR
jgi:hypothetical protein